MNYSQALEYIHSTPKFSRILGNDLLKKLLYYLGNPEKDLKFIHIAGTNGKGSTAAMASSILTKARYKTGLFTSPFIEVFNERIQINNELIPNDVLAKLTTDVKEAMEIHDAFVSEFALICAVAFLYFKQEQCDIVVLETGLGGRLDGTNVVENKILSVLTSISLDHTMYLGDTIEQITLEKCGIIKDNCTVILNPVQQECVFEIVKNYCKEKNAGLIIPSIPKASENGFIYNEKSYKLSLKGSYQLYNAAVTLEIINQLKNKGYIIDDECVRYGLENTAWPARFEFITDKLIIDGSHNPGGVYELKNSLIDIKDETVLVIAMMSDKAFSECVEIFSKITQNVIVTQIDMPRCLNAEELCSEFEKHGVLPKIIKDPLKAVDFAIKSRKTVCISGSLYLAGMIRSNISSLNIQ